VEGQVRKRPVRAVVVLRRPEPRQPVDHRRAGALVRPAVRRRGDARGHFAPASAFGCHRPGWPRRSFRLSTGSGTRMPTPPCGSTPTPNPCTTWTRRTPSTSCTGDEHWCAKWAVRRTRDHPGRLPRSGFEATQERICRSVVVPQSCRFRHGFEEGRRVVLRRNAAELHALGRVSVGQDGSSLHETVQLVDVGKPPDISRRIRRRAA